MYNIQADPRLGVGKVAVRRIPCGCMGCYNRLSLPWDNQLSPDKQERYAEHDDCEFHSVFGRMNDWRIITLESSNVDEEEIEEANKIILDGFAENMLVGEVVQLLLNEVSIMNLSKSATFINNHSYQTQHVIP